MLLVNVLLVVVVEVFVLLVVVLRVLLVIVEVVVVVVGGTHIGVWTPSLLLCIPWPPLASAIFSHKELDRLVEFQNV